MKNGYCLSVDWNDPEIKRACASSGANSERHQKFKGEVEQFVKKFSALGSGVFDANKLIGQWFPIVKADVFLSHSHDSKGEVEALASYIESKTGKVVFVDSLYWDSADKMVELFCDFIAERGDKGRFKVGPLLKASEHVHCMLERSILVMMDKCDDFIFLDESSSVSNVTLSPWIYSELEFSKHLLVSKRMIKEGLENFSVQVSYHKSLEHLHNASLDALCRQLRGNGFW